MLILLAFAVVVAIFAGIGAFVHMQKQPRRHRRGRRRNGGWIDDGGHRGLVLGTSDTRKADFDSDGGSSDGGDGGGSGD
jgi:hypothetical protein